MNESLGVSDADELFNRFVHACFWASFSVSSIARASHAEMEAFLMSAGFTIDEQIALQFELGRRLTHAEQVFRTLGGAHGHA